MEMSIMRFAKSIVQMLIIKEFEYVSNLIQSSKDIARTINRAEKLNNKEHAILVGIDYKNKKIIYSDVILNKITSGGYTDLRNIFKTVLLANAHKFILIQNHTNSVKVTLDDIRTTKKIQDIANLLGLECVDYIIINKDEYISCLYDDVKIGEENEQD